MGVIDQAISGVRRNWGPAGGGADVWRSNPGAVPPVTDPVSAAGLNPKQPNPNVAKGVMSAEAAGLRTTPPAPSTLPAVQNRPNFTVGGSGPTVAGPDIGGFRDPGVVPEPTLRNAGGAATTPGGASASSQWNPKTQSFNPTASAAPVAEAAAAPETRLGRAAYATGKVAGTVGRFAGGLAATAPLAGFGDYHINDDVDSSAGGVAKNFFTGEFAKAGDGLRKGAVEAGLDSISGLAKTADMAGHLVGADLGLHRAFDTRVRSDLGSMLVPAPGSAAVAGPAAAPAVDQSAAETARLKAAQGTAPVGTVTPGVVAPTAAPTTPVPFTDDIKVNTTTDANGLRTLSATGTGQSPQNADGSWKYSSINGVPVDKIDGKPTFYGDPNSEYNRQVRSGQIADRNGIVHTPQGGGALGAQQNATSGVESELTSLLSQQHAVLNDPNATPLQRGTAMNIINHIGGSMAGLRGTQYAADKSSAASMYGHELGLRQAQVQRDWDRTKFGIEQGNRDREYAMKEKEFGLNIDKENRAAHDTAVKNFTDQLGTMFTTQDKEGKSIPDTARVGDAMGKVMEEVGARIQELRNVAKTDPNYARAQQMADLLSKRGLSALDEEDKRELLSQLDLRDRVKQQHGVGPGRSTFVDSRLSGYAQQKREGNLIGSDTLRLRNGGSIREADTRYTEPANSIMPDWFKQRTDRYDAGLGRK